MRLSLFFFLTTGRCGFLVRFLRGSEGFGRVLHRLLGVFVSGQMIFFAVMNGGRAVSVCRQFVKLGGSLMGVLWHSVSFQRMANRRSLGKSATPSIRLGFNPLWGFRFFARCFPCHAKEHPAISLSPSD
jgi:hypothetical protein